MRNALVALLLVVAMLAPRRALADEEDDKADKNAHVSARFTTRRPVSQLRSDACALTAPFKVDGQERTWDVWFESQRCSALPPDVDSIPLHVHAVDTGGNDGFHTVTLDATSDEISEPTLRRAVTTTGVALRDAHVVVPTATEQVQTPQQQARGGGHAQGTAIAVAATAGGIAITVVVVVVVVLVGVAIAGLAALFSSIGKGF